MVKSAAATGAPMRRGGAASAAATRKVARVTTLRQPGRLTKHGQNAPSGRGCLATSRTGRACPRPRFEKGIPYCRECMRTGDPSLRVAQHPKFGRILVATRDLPAPYYVAWWGDLKPQKSLPHKRWEWALQTRKGMIDACRHKGSQLQFCACPGPNELPTIDFAPNHDTLLVKAKKACEVFRTVRDIPKGHQLTMMYNVDEKSTDKFFKERGLCRADVGTSRYPALRKKTAGPAPWESSKAAGGA